MDYPKHTRTLAWIIAAGLGCTAPAANACSICRCGDPTFNALGKDILSASGWRLAFDFERFDKSQGAPDASESAVEHRYTAVAAYTVADRLSVVARLPYSERTLTEVADGASEVTHTTGLADPEVYAQVRLWASRLTGDLGRRANLSATFGVKTDWGVNDAARGGLRLDEHAQPGTGSTDLFTGLSGYYLFDRRSALFASVQMRFPGRNEFGYRYGRIALANLAYEHKLASRLDSVFELNYRHARRDQPDFAGSIDGDTGGSVLYLTPRLLLDMGRRIVVRLAAQLPVASALYGTQTEHTVYNIGFTFSPGASD
jgi:hypothetical protein